MKCKRCEVCRKLLPLEVSKMRLQKLQLQLQQQLYWINNKIKFNELENPQVAIKIFDAGSRKGSKKKKTNKRGRNAYRLHHHITISLNGHNFECK